VRRRVSTASRYRTPHEKIPLPTTPGLRGSPLNTSFPWLGLAGAIVLLLLLFGSNILRSDKAVSRWRDLTWLSWAGATAYLIHNVEEYGIDLFGRTYAFPMSMCQLFGF